MRLTANLVNSFQELRSLARRDWKVVDLQGECNWLEETVLGSVYSLMIHDPKPNQSTTDYDC